MAEAERDEVRAALEKYVGQPMGPPAAAPDPVNVPMIRHWVAALDDRNPIYLDHDFAKKTRHGGLVAPPAMLQTWTMPTPKIEGIAERGGSPVEASQENVVKALDRAGFTGTLATNSELEFVRYLRPGERLRTTSVLESISQRKTTGLGQGYFVTWVTRYRTESGELVGRQRFRIFKFDPRTIEPGQRKEAR
jgi:acyl dehydratase